MNQLNNLRTRFAPTPSGYLHIGNAWSFFLTWLLARHYGGSIHLRIDDLDQTRYRREYLDDIFTSLEWLGFTWDSGPKNSEDFLNNFSQLNYHKEYRMALDILLNQSADSSSAVYACECSRKQIIKLRGDTGNLIPQIIPVEYSALVYPGLCRHKNLPIRPAPLWQSGKGIESAAANKSLRITIQSDLAVTIVNPFFKSETEFPFQTLGDFVIWQKNGQPAYQLASVVDDERLGINFILRGCDLLPSTGAQLFLASCLGYKKFLAAQFFHHGLVMGLHGEKLSKSTQVVSPGFTSDVNTLKSLRSKPQGREKLLKGFARALGLLTTEANTMQYSTLQGILADFRPEKISNKDQSDIDFKMLNYF